MAETFLILIGLSYGLLAAAGVFTVLVTVGLTPRFLGRTKTARKIYLYEEIICAGTIVGALCSVFRRFCTLAADLRRWWPEYLKIWEGIGVALQIVYGLFAGIFVGCLALTIAEMLDAIPIFARRISFRHGVGIAVLCMALGKLCGSLFYFWD